MRKHHVSPYVTFFMGLFMVVAASVYTLIMADAVDLQAMDRSVKTWFMIPAILLLMTGGVAMVKGIISLSVLKYDKTTDEWIERPLSKEEWRRS